MNKEKEFNSYIFKNQSSKNKKTIIAQKRKSIDGLIC